MKISLSKEALLASIQRIQNVVSSRAATLPILSNILIEATDGGVRMTTTDLEVAIRCDVSEAKIERAGATTIPAKRLAAIVRELPATEVSLDTDSKNVTTLKCGSASYKIHGLPKDDFPPFPSFADTMAYTLKQGELADGLRKTSYAISTDETRYVLNGILFQFLDNKFTLVATDGRRLALYESDLEFPKKLERDFIIPTKAVNELQRALGEQGDIEIAAGDNLAVFRVPGIELATKLVAGKYPNYKQVIPGEAKERVTIEREPFLTALRRVSLFCASTGASIRLTLSENNIELYASSPEGEAQENFPVKYAGRNLVIAFNPDFIMSPMTHLTEEEIYLDLIDEMSAGVIKINRPFLYVLMPMRVSA